MFDHVTLRVSDWAASERFYRTVLEPLAVPAVAVSDTFLLWRDFAISAAAPDRPATHRLHVGLVAPSPAHVSEFWQAGVDAGYTSDGEPGPRPQYGEGYVGAFLLDPDGNSIEAVHDRALREDGFVDHVAMRVADLAEARRFYAAAADAVGYELVADEPGHARFRGPRGGSLSVIDGPPTEHAHIAFAGDPDAVRAFHADAIAAGFRDNGLPGPRPQILPGYYAAFVLDPDGNNIEVVDRPTPR